MTVSVKPLPKLKKRAWTNSPRTPPNLGSVGEDRVVRFLISQGYTLIAQNVRIGRDEIDIVMWDNSTHELVFIEVKTRSQTYSGEPSTAIDRRKLTAIVRASRAYMRTIWKKNCPFRIDAVAVYPGKIAVHHNITWALFR